MPPMVRLLFEVADLSQASPATVSRAGMVYFDPPDLGWEPYFTSWVQKFVPANRQADVSALAEKWIPKCLKMRKSCQELAPIVDANAVMSLTRLYETFAPKIDVEAFGESLGEITSRPAFDQCVREIENFFPASHPIYDYSFNFDKADWQTGRPTGPEDVQLAAKQKPGRSKCKTFDKLPRDDQDTPFHRIIVPTTDTIRNMFILNSLNGKHFHSLLVGATGTGKTIAVQQAISELDDTAWTSLTINMSAMTSSGKTQEIIESKIEKRIKNKFGPAGNKRMLMKDTFGSQPPLELLRQWIDYGCWYDRVKQTLRYVEGIHMAVISSRLQSAANNLCFVNPADSQIRRIFMTLASNKLNEFRNEDIKALSEPLTMTTIAIYSQISEGSIDGGDPDFVFAALDLTNPEAEDATYDYMQDRKGLKAFMEQKNEDRAWFSLRDYNTMFKKSPMSLVMFKEAVEICCKILRILKQPQGNALLIGVGGSGRHCQTRLASFMAFYKCFSIEITKQYKHQSFLNDLKRLYESSLF
eukprot:s2781_g3.t1